MHRFRPYKSAATIAAALLLSACSTTAATGAHYYRAQGAAAQLAISGTLEQSQGLVSVSNTVTVTIDGAAVITGTFTGFAELSGTHAGKPVTADCTAAAAGSFSHQFWYGYDRTDVQCVVFVAGERAARLLLVPS